MEIPESNNYTMLAYHKRDMFYHYQEIVLRQSSHFPTTYNNVIYHFWTINTSRESIYAPLSSLASHIIIDDLQALEVIFSFPVLSKMRLAYCFLDCFRTTNSLRMDSHCK